MTEKTPEQVLQELVDARAKAPDGPYLYRFGTKEGEYDDWGEVRTRCGRIIARAAYGLSFGEASLHRKKGTDPYGPVAALIAAAGSADFAEILKDFQDMKAENDCLRAELEEARATWARM